MTHVSTVIVGGGQAGLAMSRCLSDRGLEHVVLERGRVAERWRSERWESLRLLTPNWLSRLPGFRYDGADPNGFMTMPETVAFLERYAASFDAPVETGTTVLSIVQRGTRYVVETDSRTWLADNVVIATGYCDLPFVPPLAGNLSRDIAQIVPGKYWNADHVPLGGVLVVGASASGIQIADELQRAGRDVTIAVGHHLRVPRRYRGRDILWWLDTMGLLRESADDVYDIEISRHQPSLQLVGRPDHRSLDLAMLQDAGVRLAGRLAAADGARVFFEDDLIATTVGSDVKLAALLAAIDTFVDRQGLEDSVELPDPFEPLWPTIGEPPHTLDLQNEGISSVIWATGFRRTYPWLRVPVFDPSGEIRQTAGVTPAPGLYVLGVPFEPRRNSAFIDGVGAVAADLADHISARHHREAQACAAC
jgi:putative flavoprotein involved in K+ transport